MADGVQLALSEIAFDLAYLQRSWATPEAVSIPEVQAAISSQFLDKWAWVASYLRQGRRFLPEPTLTWLINELERTTDNTIAYFPTQAERYTKLASLAVMHDRGGEELERLLRKGASNTIAYGFHKDMLIYSMLDIAEACHQTGIEGAEAWILSLAPAIAHIDEFTDGDETRYFPQQLGESLAKVAPDRLPSYYLWLTDHEEFFDARAVFHQLLKIADLADPVYRAIARTGLDVGSLHVLRERADAGDSVADSLNREVIDLLGTPPDNADVEPAQGSGMISSELTDDQPFAGDYPPPQIEEFLHAGNARRPYETSGLIKVWLEFWDGQNRGLRAYDAVRALADSGHDVRNGDLITNLAKRYYGPTEAYRWIVAANQDEMEWSQFFTRKGPALARWTAIKDCYPDRWLQFIQDTITRSRNEPWSSITVHSYVLRLVEYCIMLGHTDQALNIAEKVLATIHELTSPAPLPSQIEWAN